MFTAFAKKQKEPKCPSEGEWIKKTWYRHTMEYYTSFKRKESLSHATTWMNLEGIVLSEISKTQKDKYCMSPLI